jgi:hypothetical protein
VAQVALPVNPVGDADALLVAADRAEGELSVGSATKLLR